MPQAGQRVRLVHELAELAGAEELLQRRDDRADVHDRLRGDRVLVLGGQALADDALHAVEADAEGLLDELADGAQAAVAEVLVLVEVLGHRLARHRDRLGRVVLDLDLAVLGDAEDLGQAHELAHERVDVVVRERARVEVDVEVQARVELVAPDAREVVALGIEEELLQQRVGGVDARRLAGALLLEELDERALLGLRVVGIALDRVAHVERAVEEVDELLVEALDVLDALLDRAVGLGVVGHGPQQDGDRQLALAVDADEDLALLVDLELEPRAAGRHEVGREDLLLAVLGLHQVGARRAHELGDDHALGAVDDEGAALGHPREVAHEDRLLADLAGLVVDEGDRDGQRARVGEVLLTALVERGGGLVEVELAEVDGEVTRVVLDGRDVVDGLAQTTGLGVDKPVEGLALDVDEVGDVEDLVQARETPARPESVNTRQDSDSSGGRRRAKRQRALAVSATVQDSTARGCLRRQQRCPIAGRSTLTDPALRPPRMWRGAGAQRARGRLRLLVDGGRVAPARSTRHPGGRTALSRRDRRPASCSPGRRDRRARSARGRGRRTAPSPRSGSGSGTRRCGSERTSANVRQRPESVACSSTSLPRGGDVAAAQAPARRSRSRRAGRSGGWRAASRWPGRAAGRRASS